MANYRAVVENHWLHKFERTGTWSLKIAFKTQYDLATETPVEKRITADLWLSDKCVDRSLTTLSEVFGWAGESFDEFNDSDILFGLEANIVIELEKGVDGVSRDTVKFINPINFTGKAKPAEASEAKTFGDRMRGACAKHRQELIASGKLSPNDVAKPKPKSASFFPEVQLTASATMTEDDLPF